MSTWLFVTLCVAVLGGMTFLLGEWLSHHLVSARTARWLRREEPSRDGPADPLAEHEDGKRG